MMLFLIKLYVCLGKQNTHMLLMLCMFNWCLHIDFVWIYKFTVQSCFINKITNLAEFELPVNILNGLFSKNTQLVKKKKYVHLF